MWINNFEKKVCNITEEEIDGYNDRRLSSCKLCVLTNTNIAVKLTLDDIEELFEDRKDLESEPNDDFDEDEFMYGSEEPIKSKIGKKQYIKELMPMQVELLKLQEMVKNSGKPFVVVFEGRDSAGKGTMIRTLTQYLDPKYFKVVALGVPTSEERKDWFNRYKSQMEPNKIIFFDRRWYNRGIVEPDMGYSSEDEYRDFMENVYPFERSLVSAGIPLFKFWFSITPETQEKRFNLIKYNYLKNQKNLIYPDTKFDLNDKTDLNLA
jgi:polyphosphate kinase 2 (PPK2 family)